MKINGTPTIPLNTNSDLVTNDKANTEKVNQLARAVVDASVNSKAQTQSNVSLSNIASQFQVLEAKLATIEAFDVKKVEKIKTAIANGEFEVDTDKVASKLIETARQLVLSRSVN